MQLSHVFRLLIAGTAAAAIGAIATAQAPKPEPAPAAEAPGIDRTVMHVQVILDHLGFSPGVIDGRAGKSLAAALTGFQTSRGIEPSGKIDKATLAALYPYRALRPTLTLTVSEGDARGPFTNPIPKEPADQAKLDHLGYRTLLEKLAERFHTTPATLIALNGPETRLAAGAKAVFPGAVPASRAYHVDNDAWRATLSGLNVSADQPAADHIVVDKSEGVLKVYGEGDQLIAQFPATMGSTHDPLPIGEWTIKGAAYNPPFHYNPDLFWDAGAKDEKARLPPGPNGPVGVVWIDISKEHYGIHGTAEPQTIGRTESHGCIRLTNWDAARLAMMVKPGTPALFEK